MLGKFHSFLKNVLLPYLMLAIIAMIVSACSNAIPKVSSLSKKYPQSKQSEEPRLVVSEVLRMTSGGYKAQVVVNERDEKTHTAGSYTVESPGVSYE